MELIPKVLHRRIAHRPGLVKIIENIGWLFFDKLLRMGVGLFVGVWVARYLGPEQFGLLNFATAFTALFGAFAALGLKGIVVRDIVRDPDNAGVTLGTAAALQLIGGFVAYLLILVAIAYMRPHDAMARSIVAILGSMMLLKASHVAVFWFESQVLSKYVVWVQNSVFFVFSAAKVVLILQHAPLIVFVWALLAEAIVVALILVTIMGKHGPSIAQLGVNINRAKTLLNDSWPLIFSSLLVAANLNIDKLMLGAFAGDYQVGVYAPASNIIQVLIGLVILVEQSLYPRNIALYKKNKDHLASSLIDTFSPGFVVGFLTFWLVIFFGPVFIVWLYGAAFEESGAVLYYLAALFPLSSLIRAQAQYCQIRNDTKSLMYRQVAITITNIFLNYLLIPPYGAVGSAIAILVAYVLAMIFYAILDKRYSEIMLGIFFLKTQLIRR